MSAPEGNDPLEFGLQHLWEGAQPEIERRLRVIESCVVAWRGGSVTNDIWMAAQREAHRLAGSLGVFGFDQATDLVRRLINLLGTAPNPGTAPDSGRANQAADALSALRRELAQGGTLAVAPLHAPEPARPTQPARVLLAEDDETIAAAVRASLRLDGLELVWARDGAEAVHLAAEHEPDLVLLDLDLPLLDGLEVCRRLRADPRLATIPIMLITGHSDPGRGPTDPRAPCVTDYLAKPFKVADLRRHVRALLAGRPGPLAP
jgi:CheY-like chemotaxis protein